MLTNQERDEMRQEFVFGLASNLTEEEALILVCLHKLYEEYMGVKSYIENKKFSSKGLSGSASVNQLAEITHIQKDKLRFSLSRLHVSGMVERKRNDHSWNYEISESGALALDYLLDEEKFPMRRNKFSAFL